MPERSSYFCCLSVTLVLVAVILLPLVVVVLGSFVNASLLGLSTDLWSGDSRDLFNFSAFGYLFEHYAGWVLFSLELAFCCVALSLLLAVPAGWGLVRHPFPGSWLVEELTMLPLSLPGIALSMGLLGAFGTLRGPLLVLAGHLLYTVPFMLKLVTSTLRSYDLLQLENAAKSLGARWHQRLLLVVLPGLRHAITVGSLLVFAVSWGEFNVSFLLNRGMPQTFPAVLYDTYTNQSIQISSAATTIFLLVVIPAVVAIQRLGGRDAVGIEQGA